MQSCFLSFKNRLNNFFLMKDCVEINKTLFLPSEKNSYLVLRIYFLHYIHFSIRYSQITYKKQQNKSRSSDS
jgi:hypothetical protein